MKTKKWFAVFLVAIMLFSLSACNGGNTDADADVDVGTVVDEPLEGTMVYDYEDEGEIFFDYPASYSHSDNTGMLTFKNPDGSLTIMVKATINTNDLENTIEYYEGYNTFEEFTQEDITIAGYDALRISYLDEWGDYQEATPACIHAVIAHSVVSHQLCGLLFRPLLSKFRATQKICQMVKKSPIHDKAIAGYKVVERLARRGIRACGKLPQRK